MKVGEINLFENFNNRFSSCNDIEEDDYLKKFGTPLFVKEDIYETSHELDIILRKACVETRVSETYFYEMFHRYNVKHNLYTPATERTHRNNLVRALRHGWITYARFKLAATVLGFEIVVPILRYKNKEYRAD